MAKHLNGLFVDKDDIDTIMSALNTHRRYVERAIANAERKGFQPAPGRVDVNASKLAAINKTLAAIKAQTRTIGDKP